MEEFNRSERLVIAIQKLCGAFGRLADKPLLNAFKDGLDDLGIAAIEAAVNTATRNSEFCPTVYALRKLCGVLSPADRAVLAWEAFSKASTDAYRSVDFDDPTINATVRNIGGWGYCCSIEDQKEFEAFLRPKFERVYVSLYQNGFSAEAAAPLAGIYDRENALGGHELSKPTIIKTGLPPAQVTSPVRIGESNHDKN